jgi:hypothetical protein
MSSAQSIMTHTVKRFYSFHATLVGSIALAIASASAEPTHTNSRFMGVGSCSASNCHGSVKPLSGSPVLQNEYYTWLKHDKHSRAYSVLRSEDGKRMASLLGIADATKDRLCLECHATYVPDEASRGEKFQIEDGVSCESCHGASERWLSTHTDSDATHKQNLANGLANIAPLPERATMCLSCHQGDKSKWVNHDLYGAGHPRLTFELDTFGALQPKHWVVDKDYVQRKEAYIPVRAWLIGQAAHAREALRVLRNPERTKKGEFPELSIFDCFSCHHSLTEKQWKHRTYGGKPGRLKLNLPSLVILQQAMTALDPSLASTLETQMKTIHDSYQEDGAPAALETLSRLVDGQVTDLSARVSADEATCTALLKSLVSFSTHSPSPTYEIAEQLTMGIQAVLASSPALGKRHQAALDKVFATLASSERFDPAPFIGAMRAFGK